MEITKMRMSDIHPYGNNAKSHPDTQIQQIMDSIREFGNNDPIAVDEEGVIIEGHGRYTALKRLGYREAEVIVLKGLNEDQKNAYRLVHNQLTMNSGFDMDALKAELEKIEMDLTEFDLNLDDLADDDPLIEEDDVPEIDDEKEPIAKYGDIWILGDHRLMCGDSTKIDDVEALMDGDEADMVFTDPPYNIDYKGVSDSRKIRNDKMDEYDFLQFLKSSLMVCGTAYVCCSWQYAHIFKEAMTEIGMPPKSMIVWDKVNPAQHLDKYFKQHELIFYYGKFGGEKTIRGDVWQLKRQQNTVHPTMKPVELVAMAIKDNPTKKIVYDGFGGSGTTLIACEQLGRKCRMMELDPKYCDVIIERWERFTGKKAEKEK